ncbi:MAG TPA: hypothetical protein VGN00_24715 [Puia sp.]|jgi:hypothetical protein
MKKHYLLGLILILFVCACSKNLSEVAAGGSSNPTTKPPVHDTTRTQATDTVKKDTIKTQPPAPVVPFPETVATAPPAPSCPISPIYGDTIIYPQPTGGADYIVNPVNNPGSGKYFSWPVGMVLDANTGAINVTKSETGLKYAIGFVRSGTTDTCLSTLVIGGASYMDSVYVIASGATAAVPYFEADPYLLTTCATGNGCSFDVNGTAASSKVIVNKSTGVIDVQKTLNGSLLSLGGAFGLLPQNGSSVTTTIYYKLTDASNNALQHIDVQLVYFNTKADIGNSSPGLLSGITNAVNNLLAGHLISTTANPRPPLIVIVRRLN